MIKNYKCFFLFSALILLILLAGMLLISGCALGGHKAKPAAQLPAPTVVVADVVQKTVPLYTEYVATVDPGLGAETVEIRARVEAFLLTQQFQEGKPVAKGQILFTLDSRTYAAALKSAQASYDKAKSDLDYAEQMVTVKQAQADLQSAKAQLALAKVDVARLKPLAEQKAVPQQDYDNAATNLQVAQAAVVAKEAVYETSALQQRISIEQAKAEIETAKAAIAQAQINLSYCTVRSPISGVAGIRQVAPGNLVGHGEATLLTTVSALDPLRVIFNISENDYLYLIKNVKSNNLPLPDLHLSLADGSTYPYKGKIIIAQPFLDPKTGTIMIVGEFSNPKYILRPGMFCRIRLMVDYINNAILIPQKAVSVLQSAKVAYVVDPNNKVELRTLQIRTSIEKNYAILSGVKAGEKVIVEGQLKVKPGMEVAPVYKSLTTESGAK
jgi:membrane fusion protein (multidrug efflux system)